jgi:hypothetical protein
MAKCMICGTDSEEQPGSMPDNQVLCKFCRSLRTARETVKMRADGRDVAVPEYSFLKFVAQLLGVVGAIEIIIGIIAFVSNMATFNGFLTGIGLCLGGVMTVGFGQVFHCVRDATINTFHLRNK